MKNCIALVCAVLTLSGCASQKMQTYVGQDVQHIVLNNGAPTRVVDLGNGKRGYQWHKSSNIHIPAQATSTSTGSGNIYGIGRSAFIDTYTVTNTYITPARSYTQDCYYTFIAGKKANRWIVESFRSPGIMCE